MFATLNCASKFRKFLILSVGSAFFLITTIGAQGPGGSHGPPPDVAPASHYDVSPHLHDILPIHPTGGPGRAKPVGGVPPGAAGKGDPVVQTATAGLAPTPASGFEGIGATNYSVISAPPDTNGAVGPNHYVQWVNEAFAIFNKTTGAILYGPAAGNTLWKGFGGPCEIYNDGDPIVVYDQLANRWVFTQFAVTQGSPYLACVAVSQTPDPTGSYYRYSFSYTLFNDYTKLAVWPDAYYVTQNMFQGNSFKGANVCAYDRSRMLIGQLPTQVCFTTSNNYGGLLPSHLDGSQLPPTGAPNYLLNFNSNTLNLWKFHVDFSTPANSTLLGPTAIPVAAFSAACGGGGTCIPQAGTGQALDSLADRLMYRLAYRNFGDHESLVVNHSVTAGSSVGIRWYELRNPGGSPTVYQQGTFAPDSTYRWMGSAAMDRAGDISVGYSASSSAIKPGIRYTGRVPTDPLGTLQAETTVLAGAGSQVNLSRWGDYSSMSIDPSDDCTFWYTNEYLKSDGSFNWSTWITSFKFPSCISPPPAPTGLTATSGNTQVSLSWTASAGATSYNVLRSTTSGSGYATVATNVTSTNYTDTGLTNGTTYYYVVQAVNASGASLNSNEASTTPAAAGRVNVALAANGGVATASSTFSGAFSPTAANNGDRKGVNWGAGGGWNDATANAWPDWLEVDFNGSKTINEVDVFTVQDNFQSPIDPTLSTTFSLYGVTDFQVQYLSGGQWLTVPGGVVSGNNKVWRQLTFGELTTTAVRVWVTGALASYSRITEVEAYTAAANGVSSTVTSPTQGGTYTAGTTIPVTASATSGNGITKVDFFADGSPIGTATVSPFTISWPNVSAGSYTLLSVATDTQGAAATSAPVGITVNAAARTNVALAANGGVATASSSFSGGYAPGGANDGDRKGLNWGGGGGWNDATANAWPDWLEVDFSGSKTINEVDVFTVQDNVQSPIDPTPATTFSLYGVTDFQVQYWTGAAWVSIPGGAVSGNNLVWRQFTFAPLATTAIRVWVTGALASYSRITEVEAYSTTVAARTDVALAANGGVATASSTYNSGYAPSGANDGDRTGVNWGAGGGWNDATTNAWPDWLEVDFNGSKTINEVDVFTVQDNFQSPSNPTPTMTFSLYGLTDFQAQYWNGSAWVTIPGGTVSGNNLVWRQLTFTQVTTTAIRVWVTGALASYSRITEVEAYTP
jgi:hypothetical protein